MIKNNSLKSRLELSAKYHVTLPAINNIIKGYTWKHVEPFITFKVDFKENEKIPIDKKKKVIWLETDTFNKLHIQSKEKGYKSLQSYIEFILTQITTQ